MSSAVPTPPPAPRTAYQGNSKTAANTPVEDEASTEPRIKKIEGVTVVKTKPSLGQRFAVVFGGENLKTVGKSVVLEVLLPGARDILFDIIKEGAHRSLYGDTSRRSASSSTIGGSRIRTTSYGAASRNIGASTRESSVMGNRERRQFDFSGLVIEDAAKADEIIMEMENAIEEFGVVTVADFFEAIGETGNGFTDRKFGWDAKAFAGAEPKRVRGGWILDIPEPLGIK